VDLTIEDADLKLNEIWRIRSAPGHSPAEVVELCDAGIMLVEQSDACQEEKDPRLDELTLYKCIALAMLGHTEEAHRTAFRIRPEVAVGGPVPAALLMADAARRRGEWETVLALTEEGEHLLAGSPVHLLDLLGRRCEALWRFQEKYEEGVETARRGIAVARRAGHIPQEASLALYLAFFLQQLCRYDEARIAAEESVTLCRRAGLSLLELHPRHILGQCCLDLGDPDAARQHALSGYGRAVELGLRGEQIEFLQDFAEVALVETKADEAMAAWIKGIAIAASVPVPGYWLELAGRMREMMLARREAAMTIDGLGAIIDSTFDAHHGTLNHVLPPAVDMMKELYGAFGPARAGVIMGEVALRVLERRDGPGGSAPYRLLLEFAYGLLLLSKGRTTDALAWADGLDRASGGQLGLRSVLEELQTPKQGLLGLSRWFSGLGRLH
jgi:tetratricopeptide (TPR) repeat protein